MFGIKNKIKFHLLVEKLLKEKTLPYDSVLDPLIERGICDKIGSRVHLIDTKAIQEYYEEQSREVLIKYRILQKEIGTNLNIYSVDKLEDVFQLIEYFKTHKVASSNLRILSSDVFNDSKKIERSVILTRICNTLLNRETEQNIELKTDCDIKLKNQSLMEFSDTLPYLPISEKDIPQLEGSPDFIVIFENWQPFKKSSPKNSLFVYAAGYSKIPLVIKLLNHLPASEIIHFGDVDYDGFKIYESIVDNRHHIHFFPGYKEIKYFIDRKKYLRLKNPRKSYNFITEEIQALLEILPPFPVRLEQENVLAAILSGEIPVPPWMKLPSKD